MQAASPECVCGECELRQRFYRCGGCERLIPWCNGAHDELLELCDDCAVEVWHVRAWAEAHGTFIDP